MKTIITNGTIITGGETFAGNVVLDGGLVEYVGSEMPQVTEDVKVIDAKGCYVAPGFIDMHTHGAGGADFMDGTVEAYSSQDACNPRHDPPISYYSHKYQ